MKITQTIQNHKIQIVEKHIDDVFYIDSPYYDSSKFYIWSENGFSTGEFLHFDTIEKALSYLKKNVLKTWFEARGMDNPKGF